MTDLSIEALAHYTRGMATMFFILWAAITYTWRKRNRMSLVLFVAVSYVALGYAKDVVFLFTSLMKAPFVENLVGIFHYPNTYKIHFRLQIPIFFVKFATVF